MTQPNQRHAAVPPLSELTGRQVQWIGAGYLLTFGSMMGQTLFIAQFNTDLRLAFDLSHGAFGLLYTVATLASAVVLAFVGGLADRYSPRVLAAVTLVLLCLVAGLTTQVTHVALLGLCLFGLRLLGQGMMTHIAITTVSRWFFRFRGRALAFAQLGFPTGTATVPFVMTALILALGWQQAMGVAILFWLSVILPAIVFLLRDPPDGKRAKAAGYVNPDGDFGTPELGANWTRGAVLRDPLFWLIIPGFMAPPAIITLYFFHQAHMAETMGWGLPLFTAFFPVQAVTSVTVGLVTGAFVDRIGAHRLLPIILLPMGVGCLFIGVLEGPLLIPLMFLTFGVTVGMSSPTLGALWPELYGTKHIGAIRALASSAFVLASAVGPGLAGYLIDIGIQLDQQAFGYALFCIIASVGYAASRPAFAKRHAEIAAKRERATAAS